MCDTGNQAEVPPAEALPASVEWTGEVLPLEPVDELSVLTVCDNTVDILLPDQGPAKRLPLAAMARLAPMLEAPTLAGGKAADAPLGQHGFAALVEIRKGSRVRRVLFDTGMTPAGCVDNLRRLGKDPAGIEAIICSHGHFDHTTGLSGLIGQLGRANLPVLIHPEFWARRRLAIPGGEPFELPTTSRRALEDAGFGIIEQRQPSFLYDQSVLITGEVDRVTGFEKGFPVHQAWRGASWEPDPLILDDQALIAHVAGRGLVVLTGCGHAGIINICRYAQRLTGIRKLHAVIGGFHLAGPCSSRSSGTPSAPWNSSPPTSSSPPTAPAGRPPTRSPAACPAPSSRTASAPPSTSPPLLPPRRRPWRGGRSWCGNTGHESRRPGRHIRPVTGRTADAGSGGRRCCEDGQWVQRRSPCGLLPSWRAPHRSPPSCPRAVSAGWFRPWALVDASPPAAAWSAHSGRAPSARPSGGGRSAARTAATDP